MVDLLNEQRICFGCRVVLIEPYICCSECLPPFCYMCLSCYASGKEFGLHENNHPYKIIRNNFPLFENHWSAAEELRLLDAVIKHGIGNWSSVAQFVGTKSRGECENHYIKCYINNPHPELPAMPLVRPISSVHACPIPCRVSEDPPRPSPTSALCNEMAGYMPARGDFVTEHNNYAEMDLKSADFEIADDLEEAFHLAALDIYNNRLRERIKMKRIIRNHGLISFRRNFVSSLRYTQTLGKDLAQFLRFSSLLTFDSLYFMIEGIDLEMDLKKKIRQLQEYREMGIKNIHSIDTYLFLKQKRTEFQPKRNKALTVLLSHGKDEQSLIFWLKRNMAATSFKRSIGTGDGVPKMPLVRRSAPPLEIAGHPGFDKLTTKQKELCSLLRIVPHAFLQFKASLVNECQKQGSLKLAQARTLIKIDVNKTRKIFDLLIEENVIRRTTT